MCQPTPGRVVLYTLNGCDVEAITARRRHSRDASAAAGHGAPVEDGNPLAVGQVYPAVVVRVFGGIEETTVNLQVLLDGNDRRWVCSVYEGTGPGTWAWPPRV